MMQDNHMSQLEKNRMRLAKIIAREKATGSWTTTFEPSSSIAPIVLRPPTPIELSFITDNAGPDTKQAADSTNTDASGVTAGLSISPDKTAAGGTPASPPQPTLDKQSSQPPPPTLTASPPGSLMGSL